MKLRFSNVGRFSKPTEIELNGITVVAGRNGLGKSTISKLLFCIFDSFYHLDDQISAERTRTLVRIISGYARWDSQSVDGRGLESLAQKIVDQYNDSFGIDNVKQILHESGYQMYDVGDQQFEYLLKSIRDVMSVGEDEIKNNILRARFMAEFGGQIKNVNKGAEGSAINLMIRDKKISITINGEPRIDSGFSLVKNIVYIDDLSVIDNFRFSLRRGYSHDLNFRQKMFSVNHEKDSIIGDIISSEKFKRIIEKMTMLGIGNLERNSESNDVVYVEDDLDQAIRLENISAGTKVFLAIKQLIQNGYIEENGMMVLDEPEVHLHPEWQQVLAEMIVLMQKELNLNVMVSSHSADFILFIEYYSKIHGIEDKCNYYYLEEDEQPGATKIMEVTDDKESIYKALGHPFVRISEEMDAYES